VIVGWKPLGEPVGQTASGPAVELQDRTLFEVVAHAVPIERGLAADMKARQPALQEDKAGLQLQRLGGFAIDAAREAAEPA
jgi:hypothetical protein